MAQYLEVDAEALRAALMAVLPGRELDLLSPFDHRPKTTLDWEDA